MASDAATGTGDGGTDFGGLPLQASGIDATRVYGASLPSHTLRTTTPCIPQQPTYQATVGGGK
jgi:hypothetical protein